MFILEPLKKQLGIQTIIATDFDIHSGRIVGANCKGQEKVRRFFQSVPNGQIDNFYSDSLADLPLARLARNAYWVKNGVVTEWRF